MNKTWVEPRFNTFNHCDSLKVNKEFLAVVKLNSDYLYLVSTEKHPPSKLRIKVVAP